MQRPILKFLNAYILSTLSILCGLSIAHSFADEKADLIAAPIKSLDTLLAAAQTSSQKKSADSAKNVESFYQQIVEFNKTLRTSDLDSDGQTALLRGLKWERSLKQLLDSDLNCNVTEEISSLYTGNAKTAGGHPEVTSILAYIKKICKNTSLKTVLFTTKRKN